ncbi:MAG: transglycosylase domain-containing protein [Gammaproteobacteria bacterium]|nr:transglycosylase domain-containing protein [Gammaproteobacteria bacterium]
MRVLLAGLLIAGLLLAIATFVSMRPIPDSLTEHGGVPNKRVYLDRYGERLNVTYENRWNLQQRISLHQAPEFLVEAILISEDKRFFEHAGVDWLARLNALRQNLFAGKVHRGASTITEQVVRMIHPRPRVLWSRWLEGFEAMALERRFSKLEILEFYLNQVPYGARRRGVKQAASLYFDRDISTLSKKEMLALAVLLRSPRWFDPLRQSGNLQAAIDRLARRLQLPRPELAAIAAQKLALGEPVKRPDASHFVRFVESERNHVGGGAEVGTTIDLELQSKAQAILDNRLERLRQRNVGNGAVLVIDHESNQILSWVVGYAGKRDRKYNKIDAVLARRQPGSALKPLLYANALRDGWTAATMLDDSPLELRVGRGLHSFRNYNRDHYGPVSLREALGNSLNIPAVRAIQYVGAGPFLTFLDDLGIKSLSGHPDIYGDGLALGNGELSLYELVQAYTVLARMGDYKPLTGIAGDERKNQSYRVLSEDIASLVADILSDPAAREKEFGWDSVLNLSHQTAVKTGTSNDYRDAWAVGFNDRHTVGVWIGNLDYSEMDEVTGSSGAALVMRSLFSELNRYREVKPLFLSSNLETHKVCIDNGLLANGDCETRDEWFVAGTEPRGQVQATSEIRLQKPSWDLLLAMDPRIPDQHEYFEFAVSDRADIAEVRWFVNDQLVGATSGATYSWKVARGQYRARAEVRLTGSAPVIETETVSYRVN